MERRIHDPRKDLARNPQGEPPGRGGAASGPWKTTTVPPGNPWDEDYRQRGRLYGRSAPALPPSALSGRILEIGCGNGKNAAAVVQAGCTVTAIDISPHALDLCRRACTDPDRALLAIADIRDAPFRTATFDIIAASHVTGHLLHGGRARMAGEIFRLLAPGGSLYFRDFSTGDFRNGRGEEIEPCTFMRKNGIMTHYFTEGEVEALFSRLSVVSLSTEHWEMRVRGSTHPREEIVAVFRKPG